MQKKKPVASLTYSRESPLIMGVSSVIRWDDVMDINGNNIKISKAVKLGLKYKLEIAQKLEVDLKSETGLLITYPIGMLMSELQCLPQIGTGQKLLDLVKS